VFAVQFLKYRSQVLNHLLSKELREGINNLREHIAGYHSACWIPIRPLPTLAILLHVAENSLPKLLINGCFV
jgi:hypothetical protein